MINLRCTYCKTYFRINKNLVTETDCNKRTILCPLCREDPERRNKFANKKSFYTKTYYRNRAKAIKRDKHTCQICLFKDKKKQFRDGTLCVHHIDYDKHNNDLYNLITLCRSCHTKTNANREFWMAHFFKIINPIMADYNHKNKKKK